MKDEAVLKEEEQYLRETYSFLNKELAAQGKLLKSQRAEMIEANRNMSDERRPGEPVDDAAAFYLETLGNSAKSASQTDKRLRRYERLLVSPYFGRVDFIERGFEDLGAEKIYIGYASLIDDAANVYVYDWRAPVSSLYYRYGPGGASYASPDGDVDGEITLKRQYSIENGKLSFFFDASVTIRDEILLMAFAKNSSAKMRDIVETIQKEQDSAIRDMSSKVLTVQGVAGSGKTSVALHRAAFLLYEGHKNLKADNILLISPNTIFSEYIDDVLPGLGEDNVRTIDFSELFAKAFKNGLNVRLETKNEWLERVVGEKDAQKSRFYVKFGEYCQSNAFADIIEKFAARFEREFRFKDAVFDGETLFTADELKKTFDENRAGLSVKARLNRLALRVLNAAEPLYERVKERFKQQVYSDTKYRFEEEEVTEALLNRFRADFEGKVRRAFSINILGAFNRLLSFDGVPKNAAKYAEHFLEQHILPFPAAAPLFYLDALLSGETLFAETKHVLIDEAQDYGALHYKLFAKIFKNCSFTILGDVNQTIGAGKSADLSAFGAILSNGGTVTAVRLDKSYRSSSEIAAFAGKIIGSGIHAEAVERNASAPVLSLFSSEKALVDAIQADVTRFKNEGFKRLAVITKTAAQSARLAQIIKPNGKDTFVLPVYAAKGLEFDAVLVYGADNINYAAQSDRNLLYVACTRALHKLSLYALEKFSEFVPAC